MSYDDIDFESFIDADPADVPTTNSKPTINIPAEPKHSQDLMISKIKTNWNEHMIEGHKGKTVVYRYINYDDHYESGQVVLKGNKCPYDIGNVVEVNTAVDTNVGSNDIIIVNGNGTGDSWIVISDDVVEEALTPVVKVVEDMTGVIADHIIEDVDEVVTSEQEITSDVSIVSYDSTDANDVGIVGNGLADYFKSTECNFKLYELDAVMFKIKYNTMAGDLKFYCKLRDIGKANGLDKIKTKIFIKRVYAAIKMFDKLYKQQKLFKKQNKERFGNDYKEPDVYAKEKTSVATGINIKQLGSFIASRNGFNQDMWK